MRLCNAAFLFFFKKITANQCSNIPTNPRGRRATHRLVKILVISLSRLHKMYCQVRWSSLARKLCNHLPQNKGQCKNQEPPHRE